MVACYVVLEGCSLSSTQAILWNYVSDWQRIDLRLRNKQIIIRFELIHVREIDGEYV